MDLKNKMVEISANLHDLHSALNMLVKPADEGSKGELHDILQLNITDAMKKLGIKNLNSLQSLLDIKCSVTGNTSVRWKFVCVTLHILLSMKDCLKELSSDANNKDTTKAPPDILSVNQQKTIRTCLQFVVSMGMLPSLIPGVGISLAARCTSAHNLKEEDLLVLEKYERLAAVTRGLLACCEHPSLRSLIVAHHLGDLMAALSQICFAPLKKPVSGQQSDTLSDDEFVMTQELWNLFQQDRTHFRNCFVSFIWQVYQPFVIRELLLLHGAAGLKRVHTCSHTSPPSWLKRTCIQLLVHCLMRPRGVSALIRAICDPNHDTGKDWSKLETVVGLVTTVHTANPEQYYKNICSQILEMLSAEEKTYSHIQILVAVKCIEVIYKREPKLISQHFLGVLMDPLYRCGKPEHPRENSKLEKEDSDTIVSEEYLSRSIVNMHRVFVECCTVGSALSPSLFSPVSSILFQLYFKIYKSPSFLVSKVEDLLIKFLSNLDGDMLNCTYRNFLFGDSMNGVQLMDHNRVAFSFGSTGGACVVLQRREGSFPRTLQEIECKGDCLLHLISTRDNSGKVTTDLFMILLQSLCGNSVNAELCEPNEVSASKEVGISGGERHYVTIKLLSLLSNSVFIHERINNDPSYLIDYFLYILERDYKYLCNSTEAVDGEDPATEDLMMVIMTVAMALSNNGLESKPVEWEIFDRIVEPLKLIQDSVRNKELKLLAGEVYKTIVTRNVVTGSTVRENFTHTESKDKGKGKTRGAQKTKTRKSERTGRNQEPNESSDTSRKYFKELNPYKEAILCACDSSIPVHGHGILQLTKLITSENEDAIANKNIILKIFQDDLKYEDSYIYLLAINGLAAMSNMFPDVVIKLLIQEYLEYKPKNDAENLTDIRLKVGEVLVRVSKTLDCNSPCISTMLDAFLKGAKDPQPLIRASSLSNLGEICKNIGFRVQSVIYEILVCIKSIIQSDIVDVCSAAILVLTLLLQGLGPDTFAVMGDELRDVYRYLKNHYERSEYDSLKLHAQLALEEINKISKEFICPKQKLEKRLFILDPPSG
ncbi:hypothetical protein R5R35_004931 [Gryllus longicercus]|uniref:Transport and Golgi organization protein 6 homolog n=1 Tax=Gryllus longicercus TaxID=2509291 RepID=A0AAN9VLD3_9ORTH